MKRLADQTLYEILEIPPDAPAEQIQAAYEKARALYGPGSLVTYTLMEPDEAALLEARIEDARGTLLDAERRAHYDESLQQRPGEVRAAGSGNTAAPTLSLPPVIPAAHAPPPAQQPPPAVDAAPARPAILLGAALGAAGPVADAAPPRPPPILLKQEVRAQPPAAPARAPAAGADAPAAPADAPVAAAAQKPAPTPAAAPAPPEAPPAAEAAPAPPPARAATPGPVVPPPMPEAWTGDALRKVREARGLSIPQIAERTKVTRYHLENIEADRFASLPAQVYLRGILLTLARELRLDGQKVARSYIDRLVAAQPTGAAPKPR